MIVVVEGPSGAGKTTWCKRHCGKYALLESLPDHSTVPTDPNAAARFWVERNVARWNEVLDAERRNGLVVVDVDPFKLHYVWSKWRTGTATEPSGSRSGMRHETRSRRAATASPMSSSSRTCASWIRGRSMEELRRRRDADTTRTRRSFGIHVQLGDSLLAWYRAIDSLEPGRVSFGLPDDGLPARKLALGPRAERSGAALFDRLLSLLA